MVPLMVDGLMRASSVVMLNSARNKASDPALARGCSGTPSGAGSSAPGLRLTRNGLDIGRLERSARPGLPSAPKRIRHACSDCRVVP
jgi:hypothetical protein